MTEQLDPRSSDDHLPQQGPATANRRRLLQATAATAAATAGAVLLGRPADAANGGNMIIGQNNTGSVTTQLSGSQLHVAGGNGGVAVRAVQSTTDGYAVIASSTGTGAVGIGAQAIGAGSSWGVYGSSNGSDGVRGDTTKNGSAGVRGWANNGEGVRGEVNAGVGVHGISPNSAGVWGETTSPTSSGVHGEAKGAGIGVSGESASGIGIYAYSDDGPQLVLNGFASMPPTTGSWQAGSIVFDEGLWLCLTGGAGAASRWVKLSRTFVPLDTPVRIYDSRPGSPPLVGTKSPLLDGQERDIVATTGGAVPAGLATALSVNLTVTNTGPAGFVSLFKNGVAWPGTSSINWTGPGTTIANGTIVAVDNAATFTARAKSSCDLVIDVLGYYT